MEATRESGDLGLTRGEALRLRQHVIDRITAPSSLETIGRFGGEGEHQARTIASLDESAREILAAELLSLREWREEHWVLDQDDSVSPVTEAEFYATTAARRFSHSDSLRTAPPGAMAIRALMSALKSADVSEAFSAAFGSPIGFRTADIARYRPGHYLRRHSDTYDDRVFGLVFFLAGSWQPRVGGQLVVESPNGRVQVVDPTPSTVAALPIAPGYWHLVASIAGDGWERLSIAAHFGIGPGVAGV